MPISSGWRRLLHFWVFVLSCGAIGAIILQSLGAPPKVAALPSKVADNSTIVADSMPAETTVAAVAQNVDLEPLSGDQHASGSDPDPSPEPADPGPIVPPETVASLGNELLTEYSHGSAPEVTVPPTIDQPPAPDLEPPVVADQAVAPAAPRRNKKVHLRVVRGSKPCATTTCSNWNVIRQTTRPPRRATIDMARLRLAPSLREAVNNGEVELIINAVEQRSTVKGRHIVIFVATSLAGVTPHDEPPRPEVLPLPVPGS
jgi:hypothetical protein